VHILKGTARRRLLAVVMVALMVIGFGPSAMANGGKGGRYQPPSASAACNPGTGTCNASTNAPGSLPSGGAGSNSSSGSSHPADCPVPYTYLRLYYATGAPYTINPGDNVGGSPFYAVTQPMQMVDVLCQGTAIRIILMPPAGPPAAPQITGGDLARQAYASFKLSAPIPQMAPQSDKLVVQFPTWLWVGGWKAQTATASVPGLSATVTAAPTKAVWNLGDGGSVTCKGPGTPYDPSRPADQQSTDCSYTYQQSSAGQPGDAYQGSVTVSYGATWTATDGSGGNLGLLTTTAPFTARVGEIQAIGTPSG
jgi:hypothetical protein